MQGWTSQAGLRAVVCRVWKLDAARWLALLHERSFQANLKNTKSRFEGLGTHPEAGEFPEYVVCVGRTGGRYMGGIS